MWDKVAFGFDSEDETVNFGTRVMAVCESSVFETNTLAVISNEKFEENVNTSSASTITEDLRILSMNYGSDGIVLAINESVIIFDKYCSKLINHLAFNEIVDCFTILENGKFLVVGLRNGDLYCVPFDSVAPNTFLKNVGERMNGKTFVSISALSNRKNDLLIICASGAVNFLRGIELTDTSICENGDNKCDILSHISFETVSVPGIRAGTKIISTCDVEIDGEIATMIVLLEERGTQQLQLWNYQGGVIDSSVLSCCNQLQKLESTKGESMMMIIGLTIDKKIVLICPHTLVPIHICDRYEVLDFILMEDNTDCNNLLIYAKGDKYAFKLIGLPGFDTKFTLDVCEMSFLTSGQSSLNDFLYIEAFREATSSQDEIKGDFNSVRIKSVSESQPEFRLAHMLKKGKFAEAEEFAKSFGLDVECVYKCRIQRLLNDIQPWCQNEGKVNKGENKLALKSLLQKVSDIEFVAKCVLNAVTSDFTFFKELLLYGESRLKLESNQKFEGNSSFFELRNEIRDTLLRLNTFLFVESQPLTAEKWLTFSKADFLKECEVRLARGELDLALLLWSRHCRAISNQLTEERSFNFIYIIPNHVLMDSLIVWLEQFLPTALEMFPKLVLRIIMWSKMRVHWMEMRCASWPEECAQFLKNILRVIRNVRVGSVLRVDSFHIQRDSELKDIIISIGQLGEIALLKKEYGISVSQIEYAQENNWDIAYILLDRVSVDDIQRLISEFLESFAAKRQIDLYMLLTEYIRNLVENSVTWWYWEEAPWECRVECLLHCLPIRDKLNSVLVILKHAPVPWSPIITNICDEALKVKGYPQVSLIREQKKMVASKLILKKYNLKHEKLTKSYFQSVLRYIFAQKKPTMLEDATHIANNFDENMAMEAYTLYAQILIEDDRRQEVITFLDNDKLSANVVADCCENIIQKAQWYLKTGDIFAEKSEKYAAILEVITGIYARALAKMESSGGKVIPIIPVEVPARLRTIHFLRETYENYISSKETNDTTLLNACLKCLEDGSSELIQSQLQHVKEVASFLDWFVEDVIIYLTHLALSENNVRMACHLNRYLFRSEECEYSHGVAKKMILLAARFLQSYAFVKSNRQEKSVLIVAKNLATHGLNSCSPRMLLKGVTISNWTRFLTRNATRTNNFMDFSLEVDSSCSLVKNTVADLLASYIVFLNDRSLEHLLSTENDAYDAEVIERATFSSETGSIKDLSAMLDEISRQEQELIYFQVITILHWSTCFHLSLNREIYSENMEMLLKSKFMANQCVSLLLKKLVSNRHFDFQLSFALLDYFPTAEATSWIEDSVKRYRHDFHRLYAVTELGRSYFHKTNSQESLDRINNVRKQCLWGKSIIEYGLSYKEAFRDSKEEQNQLLMKLMDAPNISITVLYKFCRDMRFDFQECLEKYLRHVLETWEPEYDVVGDDGEGECEIKVKPTSKKLLQDKCRDIASQIKDSTNLAELLLALLSSVNYYHYEVIESILTLLNELRVKYEQIKVCRGVLFFLNTYVRICKPQEAEKDAWFQFFPNTQSLPPISKYRLPFKLIFLQWSTSNINPWKILTPELNLSSYKRWIPFLDNLELDKNTLCMLAVNASITYGGSIVHDSGSSWCLQIRNQKFLDEVKNCIDVITDQEMASCSLYFLANNLPAGADQVIAAEMCHNQALQWCQSENNAKSQAVYLKVRKKYLTVCTMNILYTYNLGTQEYKQLVLKPSELIYAIYHDDAIVSNTANKKTLFPDINKAADEIANLHEVDVKTIRFELFEEWLQPENFIRNASLDESMLLQVDNDVTPQTTNVDNDNLKRSCYLLESDIPTYGSYLISFVSESNGDDLKPMPVRLRALQCLCNTLPEKKLEELTGQPFACLKRYMQMLTFVSGMESLGLSYSLQGFASCDKSEIARMLLKRNNANAIRFAASLCLSYKVGIPAIWNELLSRMMQLKMIHDIIEILPKMTTHYYSLDLTIFENTWTAVLNHHYSVSEKDRALQEKSMEKCVQLLYSCPVIDRIDISRIKEICSILKRHDLEDKLDRLSF